MQLIDAANDTAYINEKAGYENAGDEKSSRTGKPRWPGTAGQMKSQGRDKPCEYQIGG
jgi:hypothetical protein